MQKHESSGFPVTCLLVTVLALAVAACTPAMRAGEGARARPPPIPPPAETGSDGCFFVRDVQDFRALDQSNLIVYAPTKAQPYHVRINPPAPELRSADRIAFTSRNSRICGYAGDALIIDSAGSPRRNSVLAVSRLDAAGLQRLLEWGSPPDASAVTPAVPDDPPVQSDLGD
jgi:hypothetical protein